ncbi:unnamed protein product [Closterium sp. NIES-53]
MVRHRLVSGLPESLTPLPRSPAPPCTPGIEGQQRTAPHSSSFPLTTAPFQTLHLDVWGPFPVLGPHQERYFLIVVDHYSRCTTIFPLQRKADVPTGLEPWLLARGGAQGLCGGSPGAAADFRVWGSLAHVCAPGVNNLSARTHACVFLGFSLDASSLVFYDPVTHQFFASQEVTFDESLYYDRTRPHRGTDIFSPLLFLTLEPPQVVPVAPPPLRVLPRQVCRTSLRNRPPPKRPVLVMSGGEGGAFVEGEGTGAAVAGGVGSWDAGGVGVEFTPVEDMAASTRRPRLASPPGFPSVPWFPPRSSLRPVAGGCWRHRGCRWWMCWFWGLRGWIRSGLRGHGSNSRSRSSLRFKCQERVEEEPQQQHERLEEESQPQQERAEEGSQLQEESSLIVFHDPLSDYLHASQHVVLEDRRFELGFLVAPVPHLYAILLASEGDPHAEMATQEDAKMAACLDIPIPCTHAEAVSGPWASYRIARKEAELASYRSTGTYVDAVPPPGANDIRGMWLYKLFPSWDLVAATSTRELHDTLRTTLAALDFFPSSADPSPFVRYGSTPFFVLVYVDDLVVATFDRRALASMKEELQRRHTCTDLGELQRYLGLQITRDMAARTITLTQSHMVEQILT